MLRLTSSFLNNSNSSSSRVHSHVTFEVISWMLGLLIRVYYVGVLKYMGCLICQKHRGEVSVAGGVIFEDDLAYAGHVGIRERQSTAYLGYLMVETKCHVPSLADLTDPEAQALGLLIIHLSKALKETEGAEHIYVFVLGHHVPHLHIHIVLRYPGTPRKYWGINVDKWADAPRGGPKKIELVCARLRAHLKRMR